MEETISTTVETLQEQTTPDVAENQNLAFLTYNGRNNIIYR